MSCFYRGTGGCCSQVYSPYCNALQNNCQFCGPCSVGASCANWNGQMRFGNSCCAKRLRLATETTSLKRKSFSKRIAEEEAKDQLNQNKRKHKKRKNPQDLEIMFKALENYCDPENCTNECGKCEMANNKSATSLKECNSKASCVLPGEQTKMKKPNGKKYTSALEIRDKTGTLANSSERTKSGRNENQMTIKAAENIEGTKATPQQLKGKLPNTEATEATTERKQFNELEICNILTDLLVKKFKAIDFTKKMLSSKKYEPISSLCCSKCICDVCSCLGSANFTEVESKIGTATGALISDNLNKEKNAAHKINEAKKMKAPIETLPKGMSPMAAINTRRGKAKSEQRLSTDASTSMTDSKDDEMATMLEKALNCCSPIDNLLNQLNEIRSKCCQVSSKGYYSEVDEDLSERSLRKNKKIKGKKKLLTKHAGGSKRSSTESKVEEKKRKEDDRQYNVTSSAQSSSGSRLKESCNLKTCTSKECPAKKLSKSVIEVLTYASNLRVGRSNKSLGAESSEASKESTAQVMSQRKSNGTSQEPTAEQDLSQRKSNKALQRSSLIESAQIGYDSRSPSRGSTSSSLIAEHYARPRTHNRPPETMSNVKSSDPSISSPDIRAPINSSAQIHSTTTDKKQSVTSPYNRKSNTPSPGNLKKSITSSDNRTSSTPEDKRQTADKKLSIRHPDKKPPLDKKASISSSDKRSNASDKRQHITSPDNTRSNTSPDEAVCNINTCTSKECPIKKSLQLKALTQEETPEDLPVIKYTRSSQTEPMDASLHKDLKSNVRVPSPQTQKEGHGRSFDKITSLKSPDKDHRALQASSLIESAQLGYDSRSPSRGSTSSSLISERYAQPRTNNRPPSDKIASIKNDKKPSIRSPDKIPYVRSPDKKPSVRSPNKITPLKSLHKKASARSPDSKPYVRSPDNKPSVRSSDKITSLKSLHKKPSARSPDNIPYARSPDNKLCARSSDQITSLRSSDEKPSVRPSANIRSVRSPDKKPCVRSSNKVTPLKSADKKPSVRSPANIPSVRSTDKKLSIRSSNKTSSVRPPDKKPTLGPSVKKQNIVSPGNNRPPIKSPDNKQPITTAVNEQAMPPAQSSVGTNVSPSTKMSTADRKATVRSPDKKIATSSPVKKASVGASNNSKPSKSYTNSKKSIKPSENSEAIRFPERLPSSPRLMEHFCACGNAYSKQNDVITKCNCACRSKTLVEDLDANESPLSDNRSRGSSSSSASKMEDFPLTKLQPKGDVNEYSANAGSRPLKANDSIRTKNTGRASCSGNKRCECGINQTDESSKSSGMNRQMDKQTFTKTPLTADINGTSSTTGSKPSKTKANPKSLTDNDDSIRTENTGRAFCSGGKRCECHMSQTDESSKSSGMNRQMDKQPFTKTPLTADINETSSTTGTKPSKTKAVPKSLTDNDDSIHTKNTGRDINQTAESSKSLDMNRKMDTQTFTKTPLTADINETSSTTGTKPSKTKAVPKSLTDNEDSIRTENTGRDINQTADSSKSSGMNRQMDKQPFTKTPLTADINETSSTTGTKPSKTKAVPKSLTDNDDSIRTKNTGRDINQTAESSKSSEMNRKMDTRTFTKTPLTADINENNSTTGTKPSRTKAVPKSWSEKDIRLRKEEKTMTDFSVNERCVCDNCRCASRNLNGDCCRTQTEKILSYLKEPDPMETRVFDRFSTKHNNCPCNNERHSNSITCSCCASKRSHRENKSEAHSSRKKSPSSPDRSPTNNRACDACQCTFKGPSAREVSPHSPKPNLYAFIDTKRNNLVLESTKESSARNDCSTYPAKKDERRTECNQAWFAFRKLQECFSDFDLEGECFKKLENYAEFHSDIFGPTCLCDQTQKSKSNDKKRNSRATSPDEKENGSPAPKNRQNNGKKRTK